MYNFPIIQYAIHFIVSFICQLIGSHKICSLILYNSIIETYEVRQYVILVIYLSFYLI